MAKRSRGNRRYYRRSPGRSGSRRRRSSAENKTEQTTPEAPSAPPSNPKEIAIPESISVRDLADLMGKSLIDVIKHLMGEGIMANINQQLEHDIATMIAEDMGFIVKEEALPEPEEQEESVATPKREYTEEEKKRLVPRPPIVTVMGHVDHGKTALLDAIRETNVAGGEAGGITQRIGAYQVTKQGRKITFLDTPGHEAFTAMHARGAQATDIAVLVVAADDGVMPQTVEAISHAKAAQVPIIVAINKIDKSNANVEIVKQQLSDAGLLIEDWGGDIIAVEVSALMKQGIDTLLDMILLVADMTELQALPDVPAEGTVIDSRTDRAMGVVTTLLMQEGTLSVGDSIVVGGIAGRVRALFNDKMERIAEVSPASPAVIMGLPEPPAAGDKLRAVENGKTARAAAAAFQDNQRGSASTPAKTLTLDEIYAQIQAGATKQLNLIIKTDIQGSIEPIVNSLEKLGGEEAKVKVLHVGTGSVSENDINLASASNAIIIGFDVDVAAGAARLAEGEGVSIRQYKIIYKLIEDIDKALKGLLEPEYKEVIVGHARVLTTFNVPRVGVIAGAQITDGKGTRSATARVLRNGQNISEGRLSSLRRFTDDVREVAVGMEFGIGLADYADFQEGDIIEFFTQERVNPV